MLPYIDIIIGTAGMLILLVAYFLNVTKILSVDTELYHALNIIACIFLLVYAAILKSIPFLILNTIWATVSITQLFHLIDKRLHSKKYKKLSKK